MDQHSAYVECLTFVRRIVSSGDCMLGSDGSVEIVESTECLQEVNRLSPKTIEDLEEEHQRAREARRTV